jgi:hypothetical protein
MLSVCPSGMELQPVFQYLFLQRLPQTLRTVLGEQECGDIRTLAALADRLWASFKPQPHEVMAVQEPVGDESSEPQVAAIQPKKKAGGNGGPGSNSGVLSHADQARVGSGLCFHHFVWGGQGQELRQALQLVGKLEILGRLNAVAPGLLVYINDQLTGWRFLVDTGVAFSILPHHSSDPATGQS